MNSATRFAPALESERSLLATALGNLLVLALLPPAGAVGLIYCSLARSAARKGDAVRAARHLQAAAAISHVVLFAAFALITVATIAVLVALARHVGR